VTTVLVLCTANACRSPIAAALLARRLVQGGHGVVVTSAGLHGGAAPPPAAVAVMAARGLDLSGHRGVQVTTAEVASADLILAMTREHARFAVVLDPAAWPRTFTLRDLVRRGGQAGRRQPGEALEEWLRRAGTGRHRRDLLGASTADDVPDPAGGPARGYRRTAGELDELVGQLAGLAWPG
jgi:protein-tyrosine phosphatase